MEPSAKRRRRGRAAEPRKRDVAPYVPPDAARAYGLSVALPGGYEAECTCGASVVPAHAAWALRALDTDVRGMYRGTGLPWSLAQKRRELRATAQRHLFAVLPAAPEPMDAAEGGPRRRPPPPAAVVSFRVDQYGEDEAENYISWDGKREFGAGERPGTEYAVYVYEVYVAEHARRIGLARAMLELLEDVCRRSGVWRLVLTVFDDNEPALKLYKQRLGYVSDPDCPSRYNIPGVKYQILTKQLRG